MLSVIFSYLEIVVDILFLVQDSKCLSVCLFVCLSAQEGRNLMNLVFRGAGHLINTHRGWGI